MARDWETWLSNSTGPASATEQEDRDRTEKRIADAVARDSFLGGNVRVFVKGSYANNTNVRRDSDVDIAVEWKSWAYVSRTNQATDHSWTQLGVNTTSHDMGPAEYRQRVEAALVNAFGSAAVDLSGNKAVTVAASSTTLDADVVPCFRHKRWSRPNREPAVGIRLFPKNGGQIDNWPEQNRSNGNAKNVNTGRRYKQIVRALKRLENDMVATGRLQAEVHGYFIECLSTTCRTSSSGGARTRPRCWRFLPTCGRPSRMGTITTGWRSTAKSGFGGEARPGLLGRPPPSRTQPGTT